MVFWIWFGVAVIVLVGWCAWVAVGGRKEQSKRWYTEVEFTETEFLPTCGPLSEMLTELRETGELKLEVPWDPRALDVSMAKQLAAHIMPSPVGPDPFAALKTMPAFGPGPAGARLCERMPFLATHNWGSNPYQLPRPARLFDANGWECKFPVTRCNVQTGDIEFLLETAGTVAENGFGRLVRGYAKLAAPLRVVPANSAFAEGAGTAGTTPPTAPQATTGTLRRRDDQGRFVVGADSPAGQAINKAAKRRAKRKPITRKRKKP